MKRGNLADHFVGVGVKRLSGTEVDPRVSNGHEFQGTRVLQAFLGMPADRMVLPTRYIWLTDDAEPEALDSTATWYNSRANQAHRSAEPRLLYTAEAEPIVYRAAEGDTLFVCLTKAQTLLIIICQAGSDIEQQLLWLFGLETPTARFTQTDFGDGGPELGFAARQVLEEIGIEVEVADDRWLDLLTAKFGSAFPTTAVFSSFARAHAEVDAHGQPDAALMSWIETEEAMFYAFERHIVSKRIAEGFVEADGATDVDGFMKYSLSVQNRRKSRAGYSLENHLVALFSAHSLAFDHGKKTEANKKPDFLFPSSAAYQDANFDCSRLTLLGSKSTCKDRWRQVLSEGARVRQKHLVTLEPGISRNQTDEMAAEGLQLVVPLAIHASYLESQKSWLFSLSAFIEMVRTKAG